MLRSSSRWAQHHTISSAQVRLETLVVEHGELAFPNYSFTYNETSARDNSQRPDMLIKEEGKGHKTVVWHETDEWEHSDRTARAEVLREKSILADVNTGNCDIHLIRCSPYAGRKKSGNEMWNTRHTVGAVLDSLRLILDLLEKVSTQAPDVTLPLKNHSKLSIYYMNYTPSRIHSLQYERSQIADGHGGNSSKPQPASHAAARQSQQQQRSSQEAAFDTASGPAFRPDADTAGATRAADASSIATSSRPVETASKRPAAPAKDVQIPLKPPKVPLVSVQASQASIAGSSQSGRVQDPAQLPSGEPLQSNTREPIGSSQAIRRDLSRKSSCSDTGVAADNALPVKRLCPCCPTLGEFYAKDGSKQFRAFCIDDKLGIELCLRASCVNNDARKAFKAQCNLHYLELKKENEKLDSKREGKQLLTDVLGRCANNRFLEEYKGKDLYDMNHPVKPRLARISGDEPGSKQPDGVAVAAALQQANAQPSGKQVDSSAKLLAAKAPAHQSAGVSHGVDAAHLQSSSTAKQQGTSADSRAASANEIGSAARQGLKNIRTDAVAAGNTSKKMRLDSALSGAADRHAEAHGRVDDAGTGEGATNDNFEANSWCPCCGKEKQYLNKLGKRKFVGNIVGGCDQKVFICDPCQRSDSKKVPFVTGCKQFYSLKHEQLLQRGMPDSPACREQVTETMLQECQVVQDAFKRAYPGQNRSKMNNFTKQDRFGA